MTNKDNQKAAAPSESRREKKPYDGRPVPEGYVLAPVWLKRQFVEDASYILPENLTTRKYAGITFLIGYVPVRPEEYESLKKDCDAQINEYLKTHRAGRCVVGCRKDSSKILCPKTNRCTGCPHKGEYERYNPAKDDCRVISFTELTEEHGVEDKYPSLEDTETEEEKLKRLLEHLKNLDPRYYDIVMMRSTDPDISAEDIFDKLNLKSSRGYQVMNDCEEECRKFFGLRSNRKKKK